MSLPRPGTEQGSDLIVKVVEWRTNPFAFSSSTRLVSSPVTTITFASQDNSHVHIHGLRVPATVLMRVPPGVTREEFKCATQTVDRETGQPQWSQRGLTLLRFVFKDGFWHAECATTHFSSFAVITKETFSSVNVLNPFVSLGEIVNIVNITNYFPLVLLSTLTFGLYIFWQVLCCRERRRRSAIRKLQREIFTKYGQLQVPSQLELLSAPSRQHLVLKEAKAAAKEAKLEKRRRKLAVTAEQGMLRLVLHFIWNEFLDRLRRSHMWGAVLFPVSW